MGDSDLTKESRCFNIDSEAALDGELAVPCNPQSATAGWNSYRRPDFRGPYRGRAMLKAWPHAARACEPRQVRKEATVSRYLRAPWERRARVAARDTLMQPRSRAGARSLIRR